MPGLFDPLQLGAIEARNRILMAPMTRARATRDHVPTAIMADYYGQRASAGLILSEATGISQQGLGWPYAPGLWSGEQVEAWKPVTEAVHRADGRIFCQLWHMGHLVHPLFLAGVQPVAASEVTAPGRAHTYEGRHGYVQARALTHEEIAEIVSDYARAARNAIAAGFDGIQLHAANGYLIDGFLRDSVNRRTDDYGGTPENRVRFLAEVTRAVSSEIGAHRTAVRLSPNGAAQGVIDSNPEPVFTAAAKLLDSLEIAFLELREPGPDGTFGRTDQAAQSPTMRRHFERPLVLNSDYLAADARAALANQKADAISFGRPFIANPDLVARIERNAPLAQSQVSDWYGRDAQGYCDWPPWQAQ